MCHDLFTRGDLRNGDVGKCGLLDDFSSEFGHNGLFALLGRLNALLHFFHEHIRGRRAEGNGRQGQEFVVIEIAVRVRIEVRVEHALKIQLVELVP